MQRKDNYAGNQEERKGESEMSSKDITVGIDPTTFQKEIPNHILTWMIRYIDRWVGLYRKQWVALSARYQPGISVVEEALGLAYTSSAGFAMLGICNSEVCWQPPNELEKVEYFVLDVNYRVIVVTEINILTPKNYYYDLGQIGEATFLLTQGDGVKHPRNWVEDFEDEDDGMYVNKCVTCLSQFLGNKGRFCCKLCDGVVAYIDNYDGSVRCEGCLTTPASISPTWDGPVPIKIFGINLYPYSQACHICSKTLFEGPADTQLFDRRK